MDPSDFDTRVRMAVYDHFAATGGAPTVTSIAERVDADAGAIREAYGRLRARRLLVPEADGVSIRMAPPFSGVPTEHAVTSGGVTYHANCAWDALGIPAALGRSATVRSRCGQSREPLELAVGTGGPEPSDWLFHCPVPAAQWWDDIVFT